MSDDESVNEMEIKDQVEYWKLMNDAGLLTMVPGAEKLLDRLHHWYTAERCKECDRPQPGHFYDCSHALKCPSCKARIDMPNVEHYPECRWKEGRVCSKVRVVKQEKKVAMPVQKMVAKPMQKSRKFQKVPVLSSTSDFPPL